MDLEEHIELKIEEVELWEEAIVAINECLAHYQDRLRKSEWELHMMLQLPDTITDVFDEDHDA